MTDEKMPEINGQDFRMTESYYEAMIESRDHFKKVQGPGQAFAVAAGFEEGARWGLSQTADPEPDEMWKPEFEPDEYDEAFPVDDDFPQRSAAEMQRFIDENPSVRSAVSIIDLEVIWNWAYDIAYGKGYKHGKSAGTHGTSRAGS